MNYRVISADDHIDLPWLPKDTWDKRVPAKWRDRAPKVVETPDGPWWVCDGEKWDSWGGRHGAAGAQGGRRTALERGGVLEPGVLRPTTTALRLADMDRDGIDATVMYGPIVPLLVKDPEMRRVCYRGYNDWLAEFCATKPDRLVGAGLVPIDDPKSAADEVRYLKQIGIRTCMFLAARVEMPLWNDAWQPLWEALDETGIPIGFHLSGGLRSVEFGGPNANHPGNMGVRVACSQLQMDEPLAAVIFTGALERHRNLKLVLAETAIGWLPYMLERMDDTYQKFVDAPDYWRAAGGLRVTMLPSQYFRRQIWATFQQDLAGIRLLDTMGEDRVMWASDYPHADSTWPESQQAIELNFKEVPPAVRRKITCENAKTLYGL
ncbi:MAG: amidohydrolase family protein [Candidatus Rokubacteria bacterium]|nr:amidohydrolase family protein [Candidatus Rokubacteria bacterium]